MTEEQEASRPPLGRSRRHRVVAGVCGGLGEHLDIDPVVFRVVVAVLCLSGGLGLFLYGLAWLVVPREDGAGVRTEIQRVLTGRVDGQSAGAVLLTVIGTGVFLSSMDDSGQLFPLLLLGGLVFLAVRYDPQRRRADRVERPQPWAYREPADPQPTRRVEHEGGRQFGGDLRADLRQHRAELCEQFRLACGQQPRGRPIPADATGSGRDACHPERDPYAPWWQRPDLPHGDPLRKPGPRPWPEAVRRRRDRSFLGPLGLLLAAGGGVLAWGLAAAAGWRAR